MERIKDILSLKLESDLMNPDTLVSGTEIQRCHSCFSNSETTARIAYKQLIHSHSLICSPIWKAVLSSGNSPLLCYLAVLNNCTVMEKNAFPVFHGQQICSVLRGAIIHKEYVHSPVSSHGCFRGISRKMVCPNGASKIHFKNLNYFKHFIFSS